MEDDVIVKLNVEPIGNDDHHTEIRAHIFLYDENFIRTKIGFAELVQVNLKNALCENYGWLSLIDEVDDDIFSLFKPLVASNNTFTHEFEDMLFDKLASANSVIAIQRLFIKKEYRGKRLLKHILKAIRKFNYCPIALSPVPLQHATGDSNKELMGFEGKKKEAKKDFKKLCEYYGRNGFKRVGKSKTWVLI